jgi:hypothetical protein
MTTSNQKNWITEHRRWEDFCSAGLGVLVVLSPALTNAETSVAISISTGLAGVLITMLAMLETVSLQRWEEALELACGAWVAVSPFVLQYGGALRVAHVALGIAVAALALFELWQDRNRRFES